MTASTHLVRPAAQSFSLLGVYSVASPGSSAVHPTAAKRLESLDPELARETHLEALWAARPQRRLPRAQGSSRLPRRQRVPADQEPARAIDLLLDGVLARLTQGYEPALPAVARALAAFRPRDSVARTSTGAGSPASSRWTSGTTDACEAIASGLGRVARERGGLTILPFALNYSAAHQLFLGEFGIAEQLMQEAATITAATRNVPVGDFSILLAAWRGDRDTTYRLRAAAIEAGTAHGEAFAVEVAE